MAPSSRRLSTENMCVGGGAVSCLLTLGRPGQTQEAVRMRMDQTRHTRRLNSRWAQWQTPGIPAPGTLKQDDCFEFKISLGYMSKSCLQKPKTHQTRTNTRKLGLGRRLRWSSKLFLQ